MKFKTSSLLKLLKNSKYKEIQPESKYGHIYGDSRMAISESAISVASCFIL